MFPAQEEADRTVFVGNLEARVREEILYELFLQVPSSGKAGRRLGVPGPRPIGARVSLPSLSPASVQPGMSGLYSPSSTTPGGQRPPNPNPSLATPGEGSRSLSGPWMCCGNTKPPRHCPPGIVSTLRSNLKNGT